MSPVLDWTFSGAIRLETLRMRAGVGLRASAARATCNIRRSMNCRNASRMPDILPAAAGPMR